MTAFNQGNKGVVAIGEVVRRVVEGLIVEGEPSDDERSADNDRGEGHAARSMRSSVSQRIVLPATAAASFK